MILFSNIVYIGFLSMSHLGITHIKEEGLCSLLPRTEAMSSSIETGGSWEPGCRAPSAGAGGMHV